MCVGNGGNGIIRFTATVAASTLIQQREMAHLSASGWSSHVALAAIMSLPSRLPCPTALMRVMCESLELAVAC